MKKTALYVVLVLAALAALSLHQTASRQPGRSKALPREVLLRMQPDTGEESRRHIEVGGLLRQTYIYFNDGCSALKTYDCTGSDGKPLLAWARENHPDGTYAIYKFKQDGKSVLTTTQFAKTGVKLLESGDDFACTFFPDGHAVHYALTGSETRYVFTVFKEDGSKMYEEVYEEKKEQSSSNQPDDASSGGSEGEGRQHNISLTFTVFNGSDTPVFRQHWAIERYGPRGSGSSQEPRLELLEEFVPGTWLVTRTIAPGTALEIFGKTETVMTVTKIGEKGTPRYVRYVSDKLRVLRSIDKSVSPEVTTDYVKKGFADEQNPVESILIVSPDAPLEPLDSARLQSPETEVELAVKNLLGGGEQQHSHLPRILVP